MTEVGMPALLAADLRRLAQRLYEMGYPVTQAEVAGGAYALIVDRGVGRAAIVPSGLAALSDGDLQRTVRALRGLAPSRPMSLLAWGAPPGPTGRARLRACGVDLALYEPLVDDVLRFQVNRALAPAAPAPRSALRAPIETEIALRWRFRTRPGRVYTMSSAGAFIRTDDPLPEGRKLELAVPVGRLQPRARARVVLAKPPGEDAHPDLPVGMAIAFDPLDAASAAVIHRLVEERLAALEV